MSKYPRRDLAANRPNDSAVDADMLKEYLGSSTESENELNDQDFDFVDDFEYHDTDRTRYRNQTIREPLDNQESYFDTSEPIDYVETKVKFSIGTTQLPSYITPNSTPLDFFKLLMTPDMINQMVLETNRSILQSAHSDALNDLSSGLGTLEVSINGITANQLWCYFGICIYMGIKVYRTEKMYFFKSKYDDVPALFSNTMRYDKYVQIKKHISIPFIDPQFHNWQHMAYSYQTSHCSSELNWFLVQLNRTFKLYVLPSECIAIDESMGLCKSRCSYTTKMKSKPINLGFRNFLLCCTTSNYCLSIV